MLQDVIKDLILEHIGPLKRAAVWNTRNCPMCHTQGESMDTRGRFGLKLPPSGDIVVQCFNCNFVAIHTPATLFSKKFKLFLREIGISDAAIAKLNFQLYREKNNVISSTPAVPIESVTTSWVPIDLPKDSYSLRFWLDHSCSDSLFLKVMEYVEQRGLRYIDDFYWSPAKEQMMSRRIIIPCWYGGQIVGYVARFTGNAGVLRVPKYMATLPKGYVYNLDPQLSGERKYTILTEGVLDAFNVDGIGILGNNVSAEQLAVIKKIPGKIIVIPDQDVPGEHLIKAALNEGWAVSFPKWGQGVKDASDAALLYGRLATVKMILDSVEEDRLGIKVRYQLKTPKKRRGWKLKTEK